MSDQHPPKNHSYSYSFSRPPSFQDEFTCNLTSLDIFHQGYYLLFTLYFSHPNFDNPATPYSVLYSNQNYFELYFYVCYCVFISNFLVSYQDLFPF